MSPPPVLSIPSSHLWAHGRSRGGYGMEGAATTDPKRIPTSTGEEFIESPGQDWRAEPRKDLWCPHYFSANSSSADRIQPSSRQDKDRSTSRTDFPTGRNSCTTINSRTQKTGGKQEQNSSSKKLPAHWSGCRHLPPWIPPSLWHRAWSLHSFLINGVVLFEQPRYL